MTSEALVKDQVSAPSLLGLPPEVRLEIYRHLLLHHAYIQGILEGLLQIRGDWNIGCYGFLPETAILRTCRQIYLEAVSILYGENTFSYFCFMSVSDHVYHIGEPFPYQNIHLIKHLEIKLDCRERINSRNVAAAIQYFTSRGCEFQTFRLLVKGWNWGSFHCFDYLMRICVNDHLYAALVKLQVSRSLSIDLVYQAMRPVEHGHKGTVGETYVTDMIKKLASTKNFKTMQEKSFHTEFRPHTKRDEDDPFCYNSNEPCDEDDPKSYVTTYNFSWCLRPQRSEVQTDTATIDTQAGAA